jgi:hypothetical protein
MIEPTVLPICEGPAYGGEVEWGQNPPEDTDGKRRLYTSKNPETGGSCIWSWEHGAWFEVTATPVGEISRLREENEQLKSDAERLTKDVAHWKANHRERVDAARVLIERLDMPLERVGAYRQYLAALARAVHLEEQLDQERSKRTFGPNSDLLRFQLQLAGFAAAMWETHYRDVSPEFEPADTAEGLLSQIDNMVCGLTRKEAP